MLKPGPAALVRRALTSVKAMDGYAVIRDLISIGTDTSFQLG